MRTADRYVAVGSRAEARGAFDEAPDRAGVRVGVQDVLNLRQWCSECCLE